MAEDKDKRIAELEGQRETLKAKAVDLEEHIVELEAAETIYQSECVKYRQRIAELEEKLEIYEYTANRMGWKLLEKRQAHDPGCPAIADDDSDYEYLADAGECVCGLGKK